MSIDGTVRQWSLKPEELRTARLAREEAEKGGVEERLALGEKSLMTEEEERELAELMDGSE